MELPVIIGALIFYFIAVLVVYKLFEKLFAILFFVMSALFVAAVLYFALKGI